MDTTALLHELEPVAARLLERHLASAPEWFPHELVPWERARPFEPGWEFDEDASPLPPAVRSSLFVNLLTEDNLPFYFRTIERLFGRDSAWGEWVRRWTAEEGRHSTVIRDYLTVSRSIDLIALERGRMAHVQAGTTPDFDAPLDGLAYVALQELATRIAHHNTGKVLDDEAGYEVMKRVASDENRHHLFYRDLVSAALEVEPSRMVEAIERQVRHFAMPGVGMPGWDHHARAIAEAGIYDLAIHHDQIVAPLVTRHWQVDRLTGLDAGGEHARDRLWRRVGVLRRARDRAAERRGRPAPVATASS